MPPPLVEAHRRDLRLLVTQAERDLNILFRQFTTADEAVEALRDALPRFVAIYGAAAATLAADWYDDLREAAEVRGRFAAIPAELPDVGRTDALAGWAAGPMFAAEPDKATALSKVAGGLQRIVANADRDTIRVSSVQDRAARGWRREGSGGCTWCQILIGRGSVYSEASADFEAHDHCRCVAVPDFG